MSSTPLDVVQSPAFAVPPHVLDDSGAIACWFTDPPGVVLQLTRPTRGTSALAEWLVGPGYAQLTQRFPGNTALYVVMDMRQMTGRSATARAQLIDHSKLIAKRLDKVVIIPSLHLGTLYVKVIEATALMLRAFGVRVEIDHGLEHAVANLRALPGLDVGLTNVATRSQTGTGRAQL